MPKSSRKSLSRRRFSKRRQFVWNMKGCSRKRCGKMRMRGGGNLAYDPAKSGHMAGPSPDAPLAYTGSRQMGGCGTCSGGGHGIVMNGGGVIIKGGKRRGKRQRRTQRGGGGVPAPLVGNAWSPNPASWPGQNVGSPHNGTQLPLNDYKVQPEMNPGQERLGSFGAQKGGRRKKTVRRRQKQRGGGFGLGGIVGGIGSDLSTAYATLRGVAPPPNPNPWQGQYGAGQDNLNYLQFSQNTRSPTVQTTP